VVSSDAFESDPGIVPNENVGVGNFGFAVAGVPNENEGTEDLAPSERPVLCAEAVSLSRLLDLPKENVGGCCDAPNGDSFVPGAISPNANFCASELAALLVPDAFAAWDENVTTVLPVAALNLTSFAESPGFDSGALVPSPSAAELLSSPKDQLDLGPFCLFVENEAKGEGPVDALGRVLVALSLNPKENGDLSTVVAFDSSIFFDDVLDCRLAPNTDEGGDCFKAEDREAEVSFCPEKMLELFAESAFGSVGADDVVDAGAENGDVVFVCAGMTKGEGAAFPPENAAKGFGFFDELSDLLSPPRERGAEAEASFCPEKMLEFFEESAFGSIGADDAVDHGTEKRDGVFVGAGMPKDEGPEFPPENVAKGFGLFNGLSALLWSPKGRGVVCPEKMLEVFEESAFGSVGADEVVADGTGKSDGVCVCAGMPRSEGAAGAGAEFPKENVAKGLGSFVEEEALLVPEAPKVGNPTPKGWEEVFDASSDLEDFMTLPSSPNCPHSTITTGLRGCCLAFVANLPSSPTTSRPCTTSPKTTCFPSRFGSGFSVIKNCEPFRLGPLLAMLNSPLRLCIIKGVSSLNLPHMSPCSLPGE